jgi:hypothetical protein
VPNGSVTHTSRWSHLFADTEAELHEFAVGKLGLRRSYFQEGKPSWFPHYDLTSGKRQQAIRLGAQAVTWRESLKIGRAIHARKQEAEASQ